MKTPEDFWNKLAPRYAKAPIRNQPAYQRKLQITQHYLRPDWTLLELGCGTGTTALIHAPFVKQIHAIDISGKMVEIAQEKAKAASVSNVCIERATLGDIQTRALEYDAALALNVLHLLEDLDRVLAEVHRLLKPGGIFVSSTACLKDAKLLWRIAIPAMQLFRVAPYVNFFGREELLAALANAGFDIEEKWQPTETDALFLVARKRETQKT